MNAAHKPQQTERDLSDLAKEIIIRLDEVPEALGIGQGDGEWTKAVIKTIGNLGLDNGYRVCAPGHPDLFDNGWLYDLVWYRNDVNDHLHEVSLVLESEWKIDQLSIKYDFEKLLLSKASLKVMVFQACDDNICELFAYLENGIRCFGRGCMNEIYILAAFNNSTFKFVVKQISGI